MKRKVGHCRLEQGREEGRKAGAGRESGGEGGRRRAMEGKE